MGTKVRQKTPQSVCKMMECAFQGDNSSNPSADWGSKYSKLIDFSIRHIEMKPFM